MFTLASPKAFLYHALWLQKSVERFGSSLSLSNILYLEEGRDLCSRALRVLCSHRAFVVLVRFGHLSHHNLRWAYRLEPAQVIWRSSALVTAFWMALLAISQFMCRRGTRSVLESSANFVFAWSVCGIVRFVNLSHHNESRELFMKTSTARSCLSNAAT